jgi:hypothetical protein
VVVPSTKDFGSGVLTSSELNTYIRDPIKWGLEDRPHFVGRSTVAQSIPNNTWTPLLLEIEDDDNRDGHSTTTNTSRYTMPESGWYDLAGSASFASNATGFRGVAFIINGSITNFYWPTQVPPVNGNVTALSIAGDQYFTAGDYVEVAAYQNSGAGLNTNTAGSVTPRLAVTWKRKA